MFVKKHTDLFSTNSHHYTDRMMMVTRGAADLRIPAHRSTYYERGPYFRAIKAYRSLPDHIKRIENINEFKRTVIEFLHGRCYYSFNFNA